MPKRAKRPCSHPGCGALTDSGRCAKHPKQSGWAKWQREKGSDTQRGYGWQWRKLRKQIMERDKYVCQVCLAHGVYKPAAEVDHIKPKAACSKDGTNPDHPDNLRAICVPCHRGRGKRAKGCNADGQPTDPNHHWNG